MTVSVGRVGRSSAPGRRSCDRAGAPGSRASRGAFRGRPAAGAPVWAEGGTDELCVCDIAWVCERPENLVSHHLRALRAARLVASRHNGKMVMYEVTAAGRALLAAVHSDVDAVPSPASDPAGRRWHTALVATSAARSGRMV